MSGLRDLKFLEIEQALGYSFAGEIKIGGNYVSLVEHADQVFISGQIPRVGDEVIIKGRLGAQVTLEQGQLAAKICMMRALALLRQKFGSLDNISRILRISVFVNSADDFTQQSEVADGASEVLFTVLGDIGVHTRTSVGVYQLPKGAAVEIDLIVAIQ